MKPLRFVAGAHQVHRPVAWGRLAGSIPVEQQIFRWLAPDHQHAVLVYPFHLDLEWGRVGKLTPATGSVAGPTARPAAFSSSHHRRVPALL